MIQEQKMRMPCTLKTNTSQSELARTQQIFWRSLSAMTPTSKYHCFYPLWRIHRKNLPFIHESVIFQSSAGAGTCSAAFRAEAKRSLRPASDAWNVSGTITPRPRPLRCEQKKTGDLETIGGLFQINHIG